MQETGVLKAPPVKRQGRLHAELRGGSSLFLLLLCVILAGTIILQNNLILKSVQCTIFIVAAAITGQKMNFLGIFIFTGSTVLLNLLLREGRILFSVLSLPITEEALFRGCRHALTLASLFYMSKICINGRVPLSGTIGQWLSRVFRAFYFLTGEMKSVRVRTLLADLDNLLLRAESDVAYDWHPAPKKKKSLTTYMFFFGILAGNLITIILQYSVMPR